MLKLQDESGNTVKGLLRDPLGAIVAERGPEYNKYIQEKKRLEQINNITTDLCNLQTEMCEIKEMLLELLKAKK